MVKGLLDRISFALFRVPLPSKERGTYSTATGEAIDLAGHRDSGALLHMGYVDFRPTDVGEYLQRMGNWFTDTFENIFGYCD
ncbi:MAG: hypothetical protein ACE5ES_01505 [Candidatus Nanoarchaeia archaeon]